MGETLSVRAGVLDVGYERSGPRSGQPVVLLHGFPYDVRCYDRVTAILAEAGAYLLVPYLRGYGPTTFARTSTLRSGQQAALAHDLLALIEALELRRPIVAGFDWGGRAACLASMLWPSRIAGLVTVGGYNVQDIPSSAAPALPWVERARWYQYYFHTERGRSGLTIYRKELARLLWKEWSPTWRHTDADFEATASSFDNPDFVDVVVHSYRHRYGLVAGDVAYQATEDIIAAQPAITVPTIVIESLDNPSALRRPDPHEEHFPNLIECRRVHAGHNVPQENPAAFADAVLSLLAHVT